MFGTLLMILSSFLLFSKINNSQVKHMVQSSAVRGIFLCGQRPEVGARVKLFEHDYNFANVYKQPNNINAYIAVANHEDLLNETYTDQDGRFFVHGTTIEVEQIKPILKVYHKCLLYGMPGFRKIHFVIPSHFTNYGQYAEKILDLGVFNLEVILPDEQREYHVS